ncbi:MAG: hypothetical protein ACLFXM_06310 [Acidimicrobiia bacterium]
MTERGARQALLASVATIVLIVAGALAASGVQPIEVAATVLVVPIFAAGLLGGPALGFTAALVAVVAYAVLRQVDVDDAGLVGVAALVGARAATYAVVAHVGHLSERVVGMLADDGAAGAPSGRSAAGERPGGHRPSRVRVATPPPDVPDLGELAGSPEPSWSPGPAGSPGPSRPPEPSWPPEPAGLAGPGDQAWSSEVAEAAEPGDGVWSSEVAEVAEPGDAGDAAWWRGSEEPAAWAESSWSPEPGWSQQPDAAGTSWVPEPAGAAEPGDGVWSSEVAEVAEPGDAGDAAWWRGSEEPAAWAESSWSPEPPWSQQPAAAWDPAAPVAAADLRSDEREGWPDEGDERAPSVGEGYEQVGWDESVLSEHSMPPAPAPPPVERPSPSPGRSAAAAIDPETRLWSAQYLCDRLAAEQTRASYDRAPYSLVMVQVPDAPLAALPHRRQVTLLRELGHQFVAGGLVDHLVHVPDGSQHWFAVVLPEVDRAGAQAVEQRLRTGIRGYLRSRGLRLDDVQSASLTAPDDDPAMDAIWESLVGHGDPDAQPALAYEE